MSSENIFDRGYQCHLARSCAQKVVDTLFMQDDDFVIDLFYHFKGIVKRKLHRETTWHLPTQKLRRLSNM